MCTHTRHQRRDDGFTMVEILVTISLVALLAAVALVSYHSLANRARNARIVSSMAQLRIIAEDVFEENNAAGYCTEVACAATDPRMNVYKADIDDMNGDDGVLNDTKLFPDTPPALTFCAQTILRGGDKYCVDSLGTFTASAAGESGTCDITTDPLSPRCK